MVNLGNKLVHFSSIRKNGKVASVYVIIINPDLLQNHAVFLLSMCAYLFFLSRHNERAQIHKKYLIILLSCRKMLVVISQFFEMLLFPS